MPVSMNLQYCRWNVEGIIEDTRAWTTDCGRS